MSYPLNYRPYNERSLLIQWPKEIDVAILNDINRFKATVEAQYKEVHPLVSYNELLLEFNRPIENIKALISDLKKDYKHLKEQVYKPSLIEIPVCYDPVFGLDQQRICDHLKLSLEQLIQLHSSSIYTVYAIGFLPGFMYLGGLNQQLHHPRLEHPRERVPKGAVGIAGMQTGIYPQESPGGWQLIGKSPIELFDIDRDPPCMIKVGDKIKFKPISTSEYELIEIELNTGVYRIQKSPYHD